MPIIDVMNQRSLRLECLKMAAQNVVGCDVVPLAGALEAFVVGGIEVKAEAEPKQADSLAGQTAEYRFGPEPALVALAAQQARAHQAAQDQSGLNAAKAASPYGQNGSYGSDADLRAEAAQNAAQGAHNAPIPGAARSYTAPQPAPALSERTRDVLKRRLTEDRSVLADAEFRAESMALEAQDRAGAQKRHTDFIARLKANIAALEADLKGA